MLVMANGLSTLIAGLVADDGSAGTDLTAGEMTDRLRSVWSESSIWDVAPLGDGPDWTERLSVEPDRSLGWTRPEPGLVERVGQTLGGSWSPVDPTVAGSTRPTVRLRVDNLVDYRALQEGSYGAWRVVPHLRLSTGRFRWQWPMRVAVLGSQVPDAMLGDDRDGTLFQPMTPGGTGELEVVVVHARDISVLEYSSASLAVVVGADPSDPAMLSLLDHAPSLGLAGVLLVPGMPDGLVETLATQLSHDQPLDVATAALPGAVLAVSDRFLPYTSIRAWAADLGTRLPDAMGPHLAAQLQELVRVVPFDQESAGSSVLAGLVTGVPAGLLDALTTFDFTSSAEPPSALPGLPMPGAEPEPSGGREAAREPDAEPGVDHRRLQTELVDASGRVRRDAFVAGQRHRLRVCIAAGQRASAVGAITTFPHPLPGAAVDLDVVVRRRGSRARPVRRTLTLPAVDDSDWTSIIPVAIPAKADRAVVEVLVLFEGRTLQSATLSGPVRAADQPVEPTGLEVTVDLEGPAVDLSGRSGAGATVMVGVGPGRQPLVIDLTEGSADVISGDRLRLNLQATRLQLRHSFGVTKPTLRKARPLLVELALQGSSLRRVLGRKVDGFHDDADWIHIVTAEGADLPFELIYTHPAPEDREVPVCSPALHGATSCAPDCRQRDSGAVVCPFGFWGTSKVVERRRHVPERVRNTPARSRRITVAGGAVVSTSQRTDADDPTASRRIVGSVQTFVGPDRVRAAASWNELPEAVRTATSLLVLVTHTVPAEDPGSTTRLSLELGGVNREAAFVGRKYVNPEAREPGPIVLSLGCDTDDLVVGYDTWVGTLQEAGAEVVVSTLSPVPGKEVADFVVRTFDELPRQMAGPGPHRWGALMTAVRQATIAGGDPLGLAITAWGDGDVELV